MRSIKAFLLSLLLVLASFAGASADTPFSGLPLVSVPSATDIFPIVHGGVSGVGGVTSKSPLSSLSQVLTNIPFSALNTTGYSNYYCPFFVTSAFTGLPCISTITQGGSGNIVATTTNGAATIDILQSPVFTGTVSDSNAIPLALTNTAGSTITSNATGTGVPLTLNATNGSSPTGDLLDVNVLGTKQFGVTNAGGVALSLSAPITWLTSPMQIYSGGASIVMGSTGTTPAALYIYSNGFSNAYTFVLNSSGVLTTSGGLLTGTTAVNPTSMSTAAMTVGTTAILPKKGNTTCTLSSSTTCNATATVVAGSTCTVTYNTTGTTVTNTTLLPIEESVSGTTLTIVNRTTVSASTVFSDDYVCL